MAAATLHIAFSSFLAWAPSDTPGTPWSTKAGSAYSSMVDWIRSTAAAAAAATAAAAEATGPGTAAVACVPATCA